jgi:uncharacterized protein YcfJ
MTNDTKKLLLILSGALGISLISIGSTVVIQKILHPSNTSPATTIVATATPVPPEAPTVVTTATAPLTTATTTTTSALVSPQAAPVAMPATSATVPTAVAATPVSPTAVAIDPTVAQIIAVKPHYVTVSVPHQRCHPVERVIYVQQPRPHTPIGAGAVVGGVAGGLLGSTIGHGDGKVIASAAGAAIGALSGNAIQNNMHHAPQAETVYGRVCSSYTTSEKKQKGYEVTYMYNGQQGMVVLHHQPTGTTLNLPIQEDN